jgi:hypothetical protein
MPVEAIRAFVTVFSQPPHFIPVTEIDTDSDMVFSCFYKKLAVSIRL